MTITKLGHSCFLVESEEIRVIIDPGSWTRLPKELPHLDAVLISHVHPDHWSKDHLNAIRNQFPDIPIYTNVEVGELLHEAEIDDWQEIEDGDVFDVEGLEIEVHEAPHVILLEGIETVLNSTFIINNQFFFPADAEYVPEMSIEVMAAIVSAPFWNVAQSTEYIKQVSPNLIVPAHDGFVESFARNIFYGVAKNAVESDGGTFKELKDGASVKV